MNDKLCVTGFSAVTEEELLSVNGGGKFADLCEDIGKAIGDFVEAVGKAFGKFFS